MVTRIRFVPIVLFCLGLAIGAPALAADDLRVELAAYKVVVDADGGESLEAATAIKPGDLVEYQVTYTNDGQGTLRGLRGVLPIPPETAYLTSTATPAAAEASLDGERFAPIPLKRPVDRPDGRVDWEVVPASEYRQLRWPLGDLAAGESRTAAARVTIPLLTAARP
jgi:uncharacterized repeat protein (TIGR01451 family)